MQEDLEAQKQRAGKGLSPERMAENRREERGGRECEGEPAADVLRTCKNLTHSPVQLCGANAMFFPVFPIDLHPEILIQLVLGGAQVSVFLKVF